MFNSITVTKERKYILIVGAVLLVLGGIYRFYPDIHGVFFAEEEIAVKQRHVEKYLKIVDRSETIKKQRAQVNRKLNQMEARLISGETPSLAAVEVQNVLNEITALSNVEIISMRVMKSKGLEETDYVRIPVLFSIQSNISQLKEILYEIETTRKLLMITELKIDSLTSKSQGIIRSTIKVEGFMKQEEKAG